MKAIVFRGVGDIRLEEVPEPRIQSDTDAIVRITTTAICGTDLHFVRGSVTGMREGTILGHEGVGIVEEVGPEVYNLAEGDRVIIPCMIGCGYCSYCRAGYYAQCDNANPNGPRAGPVFFGAPQEMGGIDGLQAERARVPFASTGLVKLPDSIPDDQAILLSDIFPTGYFGADLAGIKPGKTVVVFGCGPVGQFAIASAMLMDAGKVLAVDYQPDRLRMARDQGAETINFEEEDPVDMILQLTGGIGPDRAIDAVGVDAMHPHQGPALYAAQHMEEKFRREVEQVAPRTNVQGELWRPGDAPSQVFRWAVESLAKAGTLAIIGVYPTTLDAFPIGLAMTRNLTLRMGYCNHRKYIPKLAGLVAAGMIEPETVLSNVEPFTSAIDAYKAFDLRQPGWVKVELVPALHVVR